MFRKRLNNNDFYTLAASREFEWTGSGNPKSKEKTQWKCNAGHEWTATYANIRSGSNCPQCTGKNLRLTKENFHSVASSHGYTWVEERNVPKAKSKTKWKCSSGHTWKATYDSLRIGSNNCPKCRDTTRITLSDYHNVAANRNAQWLGNAKDGAPKAHSKTKWKCYDGHEWLASYSNIKAGSGCPRCAEVKVGNDNRLTPDDYRKIRILHPHISWDDNRLPKRTNIKTRWKCNICNKSWKATYDTVKASGSCQNCFGSAPVQLISYYLNDLGIRYEKEKGFSGLRDRNPLKFDFYLPEYNTLIEYHGAQHFVAIKKWGGKKELQGRQRRDRIKSEWASSNNITLITIRHEQRNQIKDIITGYFG